MEHACKGGTIWSPASHQKSEKTLNISGIRWWIRYFLSLAEEPDFRPCDETIIDWQRLVNSTNCPTTGLGSLSLSCAYNLDPLHIWRIYNCWCWCVPSLWCVDASCTFITVLKETTQIHATHIHVVHWHRQIWAIGISCCFPYQLLLIVAQW